MHAAQRYGCRVVAVTLSREQHAVALERVREAGLSDRVEVLFEDYRHLPARLTRRFDLEAGAPAEAVLAEIEGEGPDLRVRQLGFVTVPYRDELRREILDVARGDARSGVAAGLDCE